MTSVGEQLGVLPAQHELFDIPGEMTYLNCASLSPQLRSVTAAGITAVRQKGSPWEITPPDWFAGAERLRRLAADIMGADADGVALVPSASYGIAVAAANVPVATGQSIVVLDQQYPSNLYAWRELARRRSARVRTVPRAVDGSWTDMVLEAINRDTAVVAVPNCHWTDGSLVDLSQVGERARDVGAALVVDASQSLGAYPFDVSTIQPDFLVSVGYKWLLGPYGLGYLYAAPRWRDRGEPIEFSWLVREGAEDFARLVEYRDSYRPGARRFDAGEFPQFVLVPMATAALEQLLTWEITRIQQSLSTLTNRIQDAAEALGAVVPPAKSRVDHMIGVRLPSGIPPGLREALANARVYVSIRGDSIRVAPHLHNSENHVENLFRVLRTFL